MPYKCLILLLCVFSTVCYADELEDKMQQLREMQRQLESTEKKVKQTQTKKQQTENEIKRTASLKQRTEKNLQKLKTEEKIAQDSLKSVEQRIAVTEMRLQDMHREQNAELDLLLRVDKSYKKLNINHRDQRLLKDFIQGTRQKIDILSGYKITLSQVQELHREHATKVSHTLKKESSKKSSYEKQIKTLSTQSKKLTEEQKKLQAQVEKLKKDSAELESLIAQLMKQQGKEPASYQFTGKKISWPLKGKIIRNFGQETRSYGTSVVSNGIDIAAKEGTKVVAADDGEVIFADRYGGQGKLIIIDHKNGFFTLYAYNSELLVSRGAKVKKGQTIAKSGMTGSASEPSLHFELRKDGKAINPFPYLE